MLPFTKRPTAQPPEPDNHVDTGEIEVVAGSVETNYAAPTAKPRVFSHSISDDEVTQFLPSQKSPTMPPPSKSPTVPPPASSAARVAPPPSLRYSPQTSSRSRQPSNPDDETVVRPAPSSPSQAPSRFRTDTPPTSISPSAVMATLEAARAANPNSVPPPPGSMRPMPLGEQLGTTQMQPMAPQSVPPNQGWNIASSTMNSPKMQGPMSSQQLPAYSSQQLPAYASQQAPAYSSQQINAYPSNYPPPSAMSSQQLPHLGPHSDPRMDPPAIALTTSRTRIGGRPTMSWAAALMAMGLLVGLVTAVVARGDADSLIDATASFVDPSHAPTAKAAAAPEIKPAEPATPPQAAPPPPVAVAPVAAPADPKPPVDPAAPAATTTPATTVAAATPAATTPATPAPTTPAATATHAAQPVAANPAPAPKPEQPKAAPPAPRPAAPPVAARPRPAPKDDDDAAPAPKPTAKKATGKKGGSSADDEAAAQAAKLAQEQLEQSLK